MRTSTLPLFPLPLVLFPGESRPLHIFEPRYRQMLGDCQAGEGRFGIAYVIPTPYTDPAPSPGAVGCLVYIDAVKSLPEGKFNILVQGEERFLLRSYVETDRLYRVGVVEPFKDDLFDTDEVDELAAEVRRGYEQYAALAASGSDALQAPLELPDDPTELSYRVAAALDVDPRVKQGLLELRRPSDRLRRLTIVLDEARHDAQQGAARREQAKGNGKGRPPHTELRD
jgi:Lon protease-like protein